MNIIAELSRLFGYKSFRPHQQEIVEALLARRDVFAVMPTGGGKSLCYQLPAHQLPGVCVVVSPLISLMKDQVDNALANGLRAATLNSTSTQEDRRALHRALQGKTLDLLYISPERMNSVPFREYMRKVDISFFAIDEAHCISHWGHDFRPDYLALSTLTEYFPDVPIAAFTATTTLDVAADIIACLQLRNPLQVRASFNRPNLFYQVIVKHEVREQLLYFVRQHKGESGIIYCATRKRVEEIAAFLQEKKVEALPYHAGLPDEDRAATQEAFRQDACQVIVATVAFGMGIDKPNVRFVLHADMPRSMEAYYQETGRAGRDGSPARCVMFFGPQDVAQTLRFAEATEDETLREAARTMAFRMVDFAEKDMCRRKSLLAYFGEAYTEVNCGACDVCTGEVSREDATESARLALEAMRGTGNRFGKGYLADVLVGADNERIAAYGHDELDCYGAGRSKPRAFWMGLLGGLVTQGLAEIRDTEYPTLAITAKGRRVLDGEESFLLLQSAKKQLERKQIKKQLADEVTDYNAELFQRLREKRRELAEAAHVPAYLVLADRSLREMAATLPETQEKMLNVGGVGARKWELYGPAFLEVIREYKFWQSRGGKKA